MKKMKNKIDISGNSGSNDGWKLILDEFRKTDEYKKSNGQLLFPKFFEWLSTNYKIPKKNS